MSNPDMTEALKPCPFCGEHPIGIFIHEWHATPCFRIICSGGSCSAGVTVHDADAGAAKATAVAQWNLREESDALRLELGQLRLSYQVLTDALELVDKENQARIRDMLSKAAAPPDPSP